MANFETFCWNFSSSTNPEIWRSDPIGSKIAVIIILQLNENELEYSVDTAACWADSARIVSTRGPPTFSSGYGSLSNKTL